mgnify:CR=1 FL=1
MTKIVVLNLENDYFSQYLCKNNQSKIKHIVCDSKHTKKSKATQTKTRKYPKRGTCKKMSYGEKIDTRDQDYL